MGLWSFPLKFIVILFSRLIIHGINDLCSIGTSAHIDQQPRKPNDILMFLGLRVKLCPKLGVKMVQQGMLCMEAGGTWSVGFYIGYADKDKISEYNNSILVTWHVTEVLG